MPMFRYKAKRGPQEIVEATIEAKTREEAISKIDKMGCVPVFVLPAEETGAAADLPAKSFLKIQPFGRVKSRDITIFIEQLASLAKSKIPIFEAINILAEQTNNQELKGMIASIAVELKDGRTLAESLNKYPRVFPKLFVDMVRAGESGGILEETLERASRFRQDEEDLKARVTSALVYPLFIMVVGVLTVFLLLTFGVPRLTVLFDDMGQALPFPTRVLIAASEGIRSSWHWGIIVVGGLLFFIRKQNLVAKNRLAIDKAKLKMPLLGGFLKEIMLARFCRTLSTLLANGIALFQALGIAIPSLGNEVFKKELENIQNDVMAGASFAQSMKGAQLFSSFAVNMVAVSEKSGNLESGLAEVAGFYEREVNKTVKIITSLLEPVIILLVGLVVAFIVLAMILPIFDVSVGMG